MAAAAEAIARAYARLTDPIPEPGQRAVAAQARVGIYHSLEIQAVVLGAVYPGLLPPADQVTTEAEWHADRQSTATRMAITLRQAAAGTRAVANRMPGRLHATTEVAQALREAQLQLHAATDVLVSNIGSRDWGATGPSVGEPRPHTTDGMAVLTGVGRADNLALVARLAAGAADLDKRLARWFWPDEAPASLRPLLDAAENDAWRTRNSTLRGIALILTGRGKPDRSPLLDMTVAPPVDDPRRWLSVTGPDDCVHAVDAARSWLLRHGEDLTTGQLATITRTAAALVNVASHTWINIEAPTGPGHMTPDRITTVALAWRAATAAAVRLRSATHQSGVHTTATVALAAAAGWLHERLRPDGHWADPPPWSHDPAAASEWRRAARGILARLPDLADLAAAALTQARARRYGILAPTAHPIAAGQPNRQARWAPAAASNETYRQLHTALLTAAGTGRELAHAAEVTPRAGLAASASSRARGVTAAVHLARQWYTGPPLRDPIERRISRTRRPLDPNPQHHSPRRSM